MTSKERVERAVGFQQPDRVPYELPEPWGSDILNVSVDPDPGFKPSVEGEDEWGCVWMKLPGDKTMGQVKVHPLEDYSKLESYRFPDFDLAERYGTARDVIGKNAGNKFVLAHLPLNFNHRLAYLRGDIAAWTDLYDHPDELEALLDKMASMALVLVRHYAQIGANGIISADDWGLQDRPVLPPKMFRQFFKPRYARVYHAAHRLGLLTFLHSCGHIMELLDDLIDAELDVIQMDQQENMGVENLGKKFGGRIAFWCPVDIQQTMIRGSVEDVSNYARRLMRVLGNYDGGFIGRCYPSPEAVAHAQEKITAMAETFVNEGKYPLRC